MTYSEMQTEAANRLNLTSTDALSRLGSYINQRYRRLTSTLGLNTSRRTTGASVNTVSGTETIEFSLAKIELVYILAAGKRRIIWELPYEEFRRKTVESDQDGTPREYAIVSQDDNSTVIGLYPTPNAIIAIKADGLANASTLTGSNVPAFPADFHDALILGAMADELFKMEKYQLAKDFEQQYESRVSDLRLFLAKSAYMSLEEAEYPGGLVQVVRRHRSG